MPFRLLFARLFLTTSFAGADLNQPKRVKEYQNAQQGTIELPTNFGQPFLIDKSQLKELKGHQIFHIDLVYTQFRENPEFDQQALKWTRT